MLKPPEGFQIARTRPASHDIGPQDGQRRRHQFAAPPRHLNPKVNRKDALFRLFHLRIHRAHDGAGGHIFAELEVVAVGDKERLRRNADLVVGAQLAVLPRLRGQDRTERIASHRPGHVVDHHHRVALHQDRKQPLFVLLLGRTLRHNRGFAPRSERCHHVCDKRLAGAHRGGGKPVQGCRADRLAANHSQHCRQGDRPRRHVHEGKALKKLFQQADGRDGIRPRRIFGDSAEGRAPGVQDQARSRVIPFDRQHRTIRPQRGALDHPFQHGQPPEALAGRIAECE